MMRRKWWSKVCDDEAEAEWRVFFIHEEKLALWITLSRNENEDVVTRIAKE